MNTYDIHFFKSDNLSPDEINSMRRNQRGVWLCTGFCYRAESARDARKQFRADEQSQHSFSGRKTRVSRAR